MPESLLKCTLKKSKSVLDSLIWCMARELTEEDWESDTAENIVLVSFILGLFLAPAIALFLVSIVLSIVLSITFALALLALLAFAKKPSIWYHIFKFPGAYLHYRKRTRSEKP